MKLVSKIEKVVRNFYFGKKSEIKTTNELDKRIVNDALPAYEQSLKPRLVSMQANAGRIIMENRITKIAVAAVIIIAVILGIEYFGSSIDGASTAFAAAMDSIKQARTFSCVMIMEVNYEDNQTKGKYLSKEKIMFREPFWERAEKLTSPWPQYVGEVTINDYDKRQELIVRPAEKTAMLHDISSSYNVDEATGKLTLTMLDTSLRDYILEKSVGTFDDLGNTELDGQTVWMIRSKKKSWITTLWINPETNYPVQIELKNSEQNRSPILYTSIQIDAEIDDKLFSLEPPEGYELKNMGKAGWTDYQNKVSAKIMHLGLFCALYRDKHENQFPNELSEIVTSGIVTDEVFKNILSPPDVPNGPSMFQYRKPRKDSDWSTAVILYETYGQWPDNGIVVCFADGHSEIIKNQSKFEEMIK